MHYKLSTGDGNVYLVSVDPLDTYEVTLPDMIKHDELPGLTEADSFTDEEAAQKEELSIALYLDNDAFPQTTSSSTGMMAAHVLPPSTANPLHWFQEAGRSTLLRL